jgi:hypothetical protein
MIDQQHHEIQGVADLFPKSCPFSADDLLDPEFLPD